ncbi:hypothetical protein GCM10011579_002000 [Streptomyces albiflavescens]|uniref:Peptide-methionine (S)-S-oxide reductase n=1 Tax=Streptomyces albiflavescens TaxID=1623582 RepID=A0A917XQS7_9ACTN|nr:hypothetical protein GCM10011579_002000 [Streptomyces albiflavescens]
MQLSGNDAAPEGSYRFGLRADRLGEGHDFYPAEPYHQQYLSSSKNPNGYCGTGGTGVSCPIGVAKADGWALSPEAAETLRALLTGTNPVSSALRAQIPHAQAAGTCGCGCATVDLAVDRAAVPPAPTHGNPAADAWYVVPGDAGGRRGTPG